MGIPLFFCRNQGAPVCPENGVFMSSPAQYTLGCTLRLKILGEWISRSERFVYIDTTRHRLEMGDRGLRPCGPYDGVEGLKRRRSGGRSHLRHRRML